MTVTSLKLQRSSWERIGRGKLLLRCGVLGGARRFGAHRGRRGAGHIVADALLQLVCNESGTLPVPRVGPQGAPIFEVPLVMPTFLAQND